MQQQQAYHGMQQPAGAMMHPTQQQHTPVTSPFASPVLSASSSPFLPPHHPYAAHQFHPHHYQPHYPFAGGAHYPAAGPTSTTASPFSSPTVSPAMTAITSASMSTIPMATLKLDQHGDDGVAPTTTTTSVRPSSRAAPPKLGAAASPILAAKRVPSKPAAKRARKQSQQQADEEDAGRMSDNGSAGSMENDDLESAPASAAASSNRRVTTIKDDPSDLVLSSKRRPAPRILSPEAEYEDASDEDETLRSDAGAHDDDDDEEADLNDEEDDDEEEFEERNSSAHKRKSPRNRGANAGSKPNAKSTKSASGGAPPVRCRRGRGRALLGLNVVVTVGRYKGEVGFVTKGANGYYSVQFHRPMPELRSLENTAMKRSSELAPITNTGRRLVLPLSPEQRKQCKMEAAAGLGAAAAAVAARSVRNEAAAAASAVVAPTPSHPSPSFIAATNPPSTATTSHKRKAVAASTPARRASVSRRGDAVGASTVTPVLATAIGVANKQPKQQPASSQAHISQPPSSRVRRASDAAASLAAGSDSDSHSSDCSSCCSRSSSSASSPSLAQASETDEAYFSDDSRGPRSRGGGAATVGARRKWSSRRASGVGAGAPGSGSGVRGRGSSSCSEASTSSLYDSPAVTELYATPRSSLTAASPSARGSGHYALQMSLPAITLPPAHGDLQHPPLSHGGQHLSTTSLGLLRAQSPRVKKAACILLALSSEGLVESPQDDAGMMPTSLPLSMPPMKTHESAGGEHVTYDLTHIEPSH